MLLRFVSQPESYLRNYHDLAEDFIQPHCLSGPYCGTNATPEAWACRLKCLVTCGWFVTKVRRCRNLYSLIFPVKCYMFMTMQRLLHPDLV